MPCFSPEKKVNTNKNTLSVVASHDQKEDTHSPSTPNLMCSMMLKFLPLLAPYSAKVKLVEAILYYCHVGCRCVCEIYTHTFD